MKIAIIGAGKVGTSLGPRPCRSKGHTSSMGRATRPRPHCATQDCRSRAIGRRCRHPCHALGRDRGAGREFADGSPARSSSTRPTRSIRCLTRLAVALQQLRRRAAAKSGAEGEILQGVQQHRRQRDGATALRRRQGGDVRRRAGRADKDTVLRIVADVGFEPVDAGELKAARLLEPLEMLWMQLAHQEDTARSRLRHRAAPCRKPQCRAAR